MDDMWKGIAQQGPLVGFLILSILAVSRYFMAQMDKREVVIEEGRKEIKELNTKFIRVVERSIDCNGRLCEVIENLHDELKVKPKSPIDKLRLGPVDDT